ncbi:unknown [Firmicutes bacterium CAG:791]|nr:unknown [Firmicutes bacterium CAG:791]
MRPQPNRFPKLFCPFRFPAPFRMAGVKAKGLSLFSKLLRKIRHGKLRVPLQKGENAVLILCRRKGTGGINQLTSAFYHYGSLLQNLRLPLRTGCYILRTPHGKGLLLLAEHSFSGAGRIHNHLVKKRRKPLRKPLRCLIGDNRVGNAHALDILRQNFRASRIDLIGNQKPLAHQCSGEHCALSPRRCTQIQNLVPRMNLRKRCDRHGTRLLKIIKSRLMKRRFSGSCRLIIEKAKGRSPRNRTKTEF